LRTPLSAALIAILVALAAHSAHATTIAQFTFVEGDLYSIASSDADPNSAAGFLLNGPLGVDITAGNPAPGLVVSLPFSNAGELYQSAIITLTPAAGYELNLSSLQFDASRFFGAEGIPSATYLAAIRTNLDGFASDVGAVSWIAAHDTSDFVTLSIDLSAALFQGLSVADLAGVGGTLKLEFFFAMTSDPAIAGVNTFVDNIVVNGTGSVPEPASALLVAIGLASLARPGRRA
jgi:hypothetical protein